MFDYVALWAASTKCMLALCNEVLCLAALVKRSVMSHVLVVY